MWQSTLGEMEVQLTKAHFATWLKNSRPIDKKDDTLFVALPSNFAKTWVEEKYQKNIIGIVRNMDTSVKKIEFVVGNKNLPASKAPSDVKEAQERAGPSLISIKPTQKPASTPNTPSHRLLLARQTSLRSPQRPRSRKRREKNIIRSLFMAEWDSGKHISSRELAMSLSQSSRGR